MADLSVTIDNSGFGAFEDEVRRKLALLVKKTVYDVVGRAQSLAPVDTGALKSSIQAGEFSDDGLQGEVVVGVEYGIYQEFGTDRCPPHPYLVPATDAYRAPFIRVAQRIMNGE